LTVVARLSRSQEFRSSCRLADLPSCRLVWSLRWRQQAVETIVARAVRSQRAGKHSLLCGDPVPPGEVVAAPSADQLDGVAVCLLDVSPAAQRDRLIRRGDDPALLPRHVAFAGWMRAHVADPAHRPDVIIGDGWDAMRWERWLPSGERATPWTGHVIDTSAPSAAPTLRREASCGIASAARKTTTARTIAIAAADSGAT